MGRLRVGCSGWSYREWVGPFYPPGTPDGKFLSHYARVFDTVEVDSTFYRIPWRGMVERWRDETPASFTFCAKFPQELTGGRRAGAEKESKKGEPVDRGEMLARFLKTMDILGDKLGPLVVQLPPSYTKKGHFREVDELLEGSEGHRLAVEFRNRSWFDDEAYRMLRKHHAALTWSETKYVVVPREVTADFLLMRFIGDRSFEPQGKIVKPRDEAIGKWTSSIEQRHKEVDETFVFFNNHFEGFGPGSVNRFLARAGQKPIDFTSALQGGRQQKSLGEF